MSRRRIRLSGRAAALLVLLAALMVSAVYPGRQYLSQQSRISSLRSETASLANRIERLKAEKARLATDDEVERIARDQLGMVRPGETAFVMTGDARPSTAVLTPAAKPAHRPWYKRLWNALFGITA